VGDLGIIQARECNTAMGLSLSILNYEPGTLGLRFCMQSICMPLIIFFSHSAPRGASSTWKGIIKGLDMLKEGYCWRDGDGIDEHISLV
jgi:hypothetical protein